MMIRKFVCDVKNKFRPKYQRNVTNESHLFFSSYVVRHFPKSMLQFYSSQRLQSRLRSTNLNTLTKSHFAFIVNLYWRRDNHLDAFIAKIQIF